MAEQNGLFSEQSVIKGNTQILCKQVCAFQFLHLEHHHFRENFVNLQCTLYALSDDAGCKGHRVNQMLIKCSLSHRQMFRQL